MKYNCKCRENEEKITLLKEKFNDYIEEWTESLSE